jgi:hypothetical protein
MTTPPEGAQVSDDGQHWWDEGSQAWQPVADEYAGVGGPARDIPLVKFTSSEMVTPAVTPETQGAWARYEVINMGTAPTDHDHNLSWGAAFSGTVLAEDTHDFAPPLEPNGGTCSGAIHVPPDKLAFEGDWELVIQLDLGVNQGISDVVHLPFTVSHAPAP